jgi:hypothetical protein
MLAQTVESEGNGGIQRKDRSMSQINHVTPPGQYNIYNCPYCSPSNTNTTWSKTTGTINEAPFETPDFATDQGRALVERWVAQLILHEVCDALTPVEREQIAVTVTTPVALLIDKGLRKKADPDYVPPPPEESGSTSC